MVSPDAPIVKATKATDVTEGVAARNFGLRRWSLLGWDRTARREWKATWPRASRGTRSEVAQATSDGALRQPKPISLATTKVAAAFAACVLGIIGMAVGDARAKSERIARAPIVVPAVETAPPVALPAAPVATTSQTTIDAAKDFGVAGLGQIRKTPAVRALGLPTVNSTLPAEVVSRIVRQNHGRFRMCYDAGLRTQPALSGRVAVKFAIDRSGTVASSAMSSETTLPDHAVIACIVRSFLAMSFPQPDNGIATVTYRMALTVE